MQIFFRLIKGLKWLLPQSLQGRFLLIVTLPMILVLVMATYMFYERHWSNVTKHLMNAFAGEVAMVTRLVASTPIAERQAILEFSKHTIYMEANFVKEGVLTRVVPKPTKRLAQFYDVLGRFINYPFILYYIDDRSKMQVDVLIPGGSIHFTASKKRIENPTTYIFILWLIGTAIVVVIISIIFLRNQIRSIRKLALVAERFGKGQEIKGFKPTGAREVRKAAQAFIHMKDRIKKQIKQRTEMLAGVSHDLRTPLTRVKLQLAMMQDNDKVASIQSDIDEMEHMIQAYLTFAKGEGEEQAKQVNLKNLLERIIRNYQRHDQSVICGKIPDIDVVIPPNGFKRCVQNIIDNGLRYGKEVHVQSLLIEDGIDIIFEDNGSGIPKDKYEDVFKPFYRLDASRNIDSGGTGLGLTVARDIVNSCGGEIHLDKSRLGGLMVKIQLPL